MTEFNDKCQYCIFRPIIFKISYEKRIIFMPNVLKMLCDIDY